VNSDKDDISEVIGTDMNKNMLKRPHREEANDSPEGEKKDKPVDVSSWANSGVTFFGVAKTFATLPPNCYEPNLSQQGPYLEEIPIKTDDLLVLPDDASNDIISDFSEFWTLKPAFQARGFLHKRGILMWGPPGSGKCLGINTPVLMADGTIKLVQDIVVGDQLMGPDGRARNVLSTTSGKDILYRVTPVKGETYIVNSDHLLSLRSTPTRYGQNLHGGTYIPKYSEDVYFIRAEDFFLSKPSVRSRMKGWRPGAIDFEKASKPEELLIPPYILGAWLGDGTSANTNITALDGSPILEHWEKFLNSRGAKMVSYPCTDGTKCPAWSMVTGFKPNTFKRDLKELGVLNNKHIPNAYKMASREDRLELIAGLLDTDGHLDGNNEYDFVQKREGLAKDVTFILISLGFSVHLSKQRKGIKSTGFEGDYWRMCISGNCSDIPVRDPKKVAHFRQQIKNHRVTGIKVDRLDRGDYYGFEIDGDKQFLLGDWQVTHNTSTVQQIIQKVIHDLGGIVLMVQNPGVAVECLKMVRKIEPDRPIITIMEDLDSLVSKYDEAGFLSMLDGEAQVDNILSLATTNYPERLDARFIDRPSRFDVVRKIDYPSDEAREFYLRKKEPSLTEEELTAWVAMSKGLTIPHLKEMIISVKCYNRDLDETVKRLKKMHTKKFKDGQGLGFASAEDKTASR